MFDKLKQKLEEKDPLTIVLLIILAILVVAVVRNLVFVNRNNASENFVNEETIESRLDDMKHRIHLYYTNSCGYSRMFLPHWYEFVAELKKRGVTNIDTEMINCEDSPKLCKDVPGVPYVVLQKVDGSVVVMDDKYERSVVGLFEFIEQNL